MGCSTEYAKSRTVVYGRTTGNTWEGGRDRQGIELVEYCDSLFIEACEAGCCRFGRFGGAAAGGDVIKGGNGGWFGFDDGEDNGEGDIGEEVAASSIGDMTAAILVGRYVGKVSMIS